jgi:hypothetical protein
MTESHGVVGVRGRGRVSSIGARLGPRGARGQRGHAGSKRGMRAPSRVGARGDRSGAHPWLGRLTGWLVREMDQWVHRPR